MYAANFRFSRSPQGSNARSTGNQEGHPGACTKHGLRSVMGFTAVREADTDQAQSWFDDAYHAITESLGHVCPAMRSGVEIP